MIRISRLLLASALMALPYAPSSCQTAPTELAAPIAPSGGMLDASGSYYLGFDVTGDMTISTSNVILDLNGHVVTGSINVAAGLSDITLTNGFITTSSANGIDIATGCININLNNLTVRYSEDNGGITARGTNVAIKNVTCLGTAVDTSMSTVLGLELLNCTHAAVCNCSIAVNGDTAADNGDGLCVDNCTQVLLAACNVRNCNNCFDIRNGSSEVTALQCVAFSGVNGFTAGDTGGSVKLLNCIAENNSSNGFQLEGDSQSPVYLEECIAYNNPDADGFNVDGTVEHTVKKCVAFSNENGFVDTDGATSVARYIANYADINPASDMSNTNNYMPSSGDPFDPISTNDVTDPKAQFWRNTIRPDSSNNC